MYIFQIVKAKYPTTARLIATIIIVFFMFAIPAFTMFLMLEIGDLRVTSFMFSFSASFFICYIFGTILSERLIEKTYCIGILEFQNRNLNIKTKKVNKEIHFKDIESIKIKAGTGSGAWLQTTTTIISIVLMDKSIINIHATREYFKEHVKQRKRIWNKNLDLFDVLDLFNIRTKFDRRIKEIECVSE